MEDDVELEFQRAWIESAGREGTDDGSAAIDVKEFVAVPLRNHELAVDGEQQSDTCGGIAGLKPIEFGSAKDDTRHMWRDHFRPPDMEATKRRRFPADSRLTHRRTLTARQPCRLLVLDPVGLVCPHCEFDTVSGFEFGHEARKVGLDGAQADVKVVPDFGIRSAPRNGK